MLAFNKKILLKNNIKPKGSKQKFVWWIHTTQIVNHEKVLIVLTKLNQSMKYINIMSTLFILKYITPIYDLFVKAMSTILNRRSEGHKDETQLKATAQVFVCLWRGVGVCIIMLQLI